MTEKSNLIATIIMLIWVIFVQSGNIESEILIDIFFQIYGNKPMIHIYFRIQGYNSGQMIPQWTLSSWQDRHFSYS